MNTTLPTPQWACHLDKRNNLVFISYILDGILMHIYIYYISIYIYIRFPYSHAYIRCLVAAAVAATVAAAAANYKIAK